MGSYRKQWSRLYRFARATRKINPHMASDMLKGMHRPCPHLMSAVDWYFSQDRTCTTKAASSAV